MHIYSRIGARRALEKKSVIERVRPDFGLGGVSTDVGDDVASMFTCADDARLAAGDGALMPASSSSLASFADGTPCGSDSVSDARDSLVREVRWLRVLP